MSYTLLQKRTVKSRRDRRCIWCPEWIKQGDQAIVESCVFNGDFQYHHWHPECWQASLDYFDSPGADDCYYAHEFKRGTTEEA